MPDILLLTAYVDYLRAYGDHKHCTKTLQKAINSVSDWPETFFEAYVNYEREEGKKYHLWYLNCFKYIYICFYKYRFDVNCIV